MKKILTFIFKFVYKTVAAVLIVLFMLILATSVSPVYNFRKTAPFSGPDIFNPYAGLDSADCWKRAVFHVHSRVKGPFPPNECQYDAQQTYDALETLGYDIVTFSNHNEITTHPFDTALQVNVYEQGYSPFKFHKLVFGSRKVKHFDPLLPLLASQKQFELDNLGEGSDFIQINHPYRTIGMSRDNMEKLSGYEIMELDTGISTENEYWDWALSAGHYSFALCNDDLHYPDRSDHIAVRCNFLCCPSGRYEDIRRTLLGGCYYSMRVPDYGDGDWDTKIQRNHELPYVTGIGLDGDTIHMELSATADSIRVNGQDHRTLALATGTDSVRYTLGPDEPYARLTAFFPAGEVIYSNPFARYDSAAAPSPMDNSPQKVDLLLTILFNLVVVVLFIGCIRLMIRVMKS